MRFVLLLRNDRIAASAMLAGGQAGIDFLRETLAQFGGELHDVVAVAGRYDAVVTCDFPSHAAVIAFSLSATAAGQYVEAMPALSAEELDSARQVAQEVATSQATPASGAGDRPGPAG